mmetsp:Transcript_32498/g.97276  ORF Transcript_32498/g.97276 Transcript_32498/m.97276 type:complete len:84 (+) Transcript_32498:584-835(+)
MALLAAIDDIPATSPAVAAGILAAVIDNSALEVTELLLVVVHQNDLIPLKRWQDGGRNLKEGWNGGLPKPLEDPPALGWKKRA